jgi:outer membrane protein TolC
MQKRTQRFSLLIVFAGVVLLSSMAANGQVAPPIRTDTARQQQDTTRVFSLSDFLQQVLRYHPIVKQAALLTDEARAKVQEAWGGFDPKLSAGWDKKEFANSTYYNYWTSELKVPLWVAGADLKVGFDRTRGSYINPDKRTNRDGLSIVGLSVPIGSGLLIDSRRNTLQQARLMVNYAEADRIKQINTVVFDAVQQYWDWYYAYTQYRLVDNGVLLAQQRFQAISLQAQIGDKPPIDSVEASITVFDRSIQFEKLKVDLQNARLLLSNYLWNENNDPLELPENAAPQSGTATIGFITRQRVDSLMQQASRQHPELVKLRSKAGQLAIESRYRRQSLLPKLNASGYLLSGRTFFNEEVPGYYDFGAQNYKFGLDFSFPLFLRAERGKLKQTVIKQRQVDFDLQQTGRDISVDITTSYNALQAYESQLNLQTQSITNQQVLLNGELQKFELGESTLFVINSRETKLIDMRIKREELIAAYQKKLAELYYKAGTQLLAGR